MGASGVYNTADDANAVKSNALALASAVVARARNHKMSALAYRMSTILFHSGAKSEDISRMNKLEVCMSPESTVEFQRKMGENCQCKVLKWKSTIENNKMALLFLEEVQRRHAVHETSDATTISKLHLFLNTSKITHVHFLHITILKTTKCYANNKNIASSV